MGNLLKVVKAILSKIFSFLKKIFKKFWPLLLIVALVFFAPALVGVLTSMGAPSWLIGGMSFIASNITPFLMTGLGWLKAGALWVFGGVTSIWGSLGLMGKVIAVIGTAFLLAPEEATDFVVDFIDDVGGVIGDVGGAILGTPLLLIGGGAMLWFAFSRRKKQRELPLDEWQPSISVPMNTAPIKSDYQAPVMSSADLILDKPTGQVYIPPPPAPPSGRVEPDEGGPWPGYEEQYWMYRDSYEEDEEAIRI